MEALKQAMDHADKVRDQAMMRKGAKAFVDFASKDVPVSANFKAALYEALAEYLMEEST